MKQPVERRLAAILAADVAGYSRMMGAQLAHYLECRRMNCVAAEITEEIRVFFQHYNANAEARQ